MNDMSSVIVPKSDQINAEDFLAGPRTFTIESVAISPGTEQPVNIKLAGEPRVFRPCKSMSRVLVGGWGPDAKAYVGRSITLYRDPKVKWGGLEVGGIRISHMSNIERDMVLSLTATKGKRAPHQVKVLQNAPQQQQGDDPAAKWAGNFITAVNSSVNLPTLNGHLDMRKDRLTELAQKRPELHRDILAAVDAKRAELENPASTEGPSDNDRGDPHDGTDADHPARAKADDYIDRCTRADVIDIVDQVDREFADHRDAMPADMAGAVDAAIADARTRLDF